MDRPLFSVVIPFRDASTTLPDTLRSLQAQTLRDWEALLIDDASSDDGPALVADRAESDNRLRLISEALPGPRGVAATRNIGTRAARGRYVAFLDADDQWRPEKLARQAGAFAEGAPIVFTSYQRIDARGRSLGIVKARELVTWVDALGGNPIGCLTGAFDTQVFGRPEMPSLPMHEDYAFWLRLLRGGGTARGLPEVLADYRVHPGSASANKFKGAMAVWRILAAEGIAPVPRAAHFTRYAVRALRRRL